MDKYGAVEQLVRKLTFLLLPRHIHFLPRQWHLDIIDIQRPNRSC
jgi:hypothetical protein